MKIIITHANCTDGCTARAIFQKNYGDDAQYIEVDHADFNQKINKTKYQEVTSKINNIRDSDVIMADICLDREILSEILKRGNTLTVIDHHKSSESTLLKINEEYGKSGALDILFDSENKYSGADLAWQWMYGKEAEKPLFLKLVSDGDTWQNKYKETKDFYAGLSANGSPKDIDTSKYIEFLDDEKKTLKLIKDGAAIHKTLNEEVAAHVELAVDVMIAGKRGKMVIAQAGLKSELGNALAKDADFGMVVVVKEDMVQVSMRSIHPNTVDDLAALYGGGGHAQASAFRLKTMEELDALLGLNIDDGIANKRHKFKI
jgi:uncharacterized protein